MPNTKKLYEECPPLIVCPYEDKYRLFLEKAIFQQDNYAADHSCAKGRQLLTRIKTQPKILPRFLYPEISSTFIPVYAVIPSIKDYYLIHINCLVTIFDG